MWFYDPPHTADDSFQLVKQRMTQLTNNKFKGCCHEWNQLRAAFDIIPTQFTTQHSIFNIIPHINRNFTHQQKLLVHYSSVVTQPRRISPADPISTQHQYVEYSFTALNCQVIKQSIYQTSITDSMAQKSTICSYLLLLLLLCVPEKQGTVFGLVCMCAFPCNHWKTTGHKRKGCSLVVICVKVKPRGN